MAARLVSLVLLLAVWVIASHLAGGRMLPDPQAVATALVNEWRSGALPFNLAATLMRVLVAFIVAMAIGSALGLLMGRFRIADTLGDPVVAHRKALDQAREPARLVDRVQILAH